jgi:hypothetical protein
MRPSPSFDEENASHNRLKAGPRLFGFAMAEVIETPA